MPRLKFTAKNILYHTTPTKRNETVYFDEATTGLSISVTRKGRKTWVARFRFDGTQQRLKLGPVEVISLAQARDRMISIRYEISTGLDPSSKSKAIAQTRREARLKQTVAVLSDNYLAACRKGTHKPSAKHALSKKSLAAHELSSHYLNARTKGQLLADLTRHDLQSIIENISSEASKGAAKHTYAFLSGLFSYAIWKEVVPENLMRFVVKPNFLSRTRVISHPELKTIMGNIRTEGKHGTREVRIALELCAVTLQRAGEVAQMRHNEIDLERAEWIIPATRTKNRREHLVPLSPSAVSLIKTAFQLNEIQKTANPPIFSSPRDKEQPIGAHALTRAFIRLRHEHGWPIDIRLHDLRRTGASGMAELDIPPSTIMRVLNQTDTSAASVTGIYNRHNYRPQKKVALDAWAKKLGAILK